MSKLEYSDYDALTVAELKDMADQLSVEVPSDARKADIIEALQAASDKPSEASAKEGAESKNIYTYQTSSTTEATLEQEDFRKLKLTS